MFFPQGLTLLYNIFPSSVVIIISNHLNDSLMFLAQNYGAMQGAQQQQYGYGQQMGKPTPAGQQVYTLKSGCAECKN